MMLKNNQHYLNKALANPEPLLDDSYIFIDKDNDIEKYVKDTKKLKELLTACKVMIERGNEPTEYYKEIFDIVTGAYGSKNEFVCFMNTCKISIGILGKNPEILQSLIKLYVEKRDISEQTPAEWIQALIDRGSQRASGSLGENKIVEIANNFQYRIVTDWQDFHSMEKCVAKFSGTFSIDNIAKELGVKLNFNNSGKLLDIIIKNGERIMFLEAKNINSGGGAQDKQIVELIKIISTSKIKDAIYLGAYLDGQYSNRLLSSKSNEKGTKMEKQKYDLDKALNENQNNYWLNTYSLKEFLQDF